MRASGEVELVLLEALLPDVNRLCDLVFDPFAFAFFKVAGSYPGYEYRQQLLITHFALPPGIEPGTPFSPTDDFASLIYGRSFASGGPTS